MRSRPHRGDRGFRRLSGVPIVKYSRRPSRSMPRPLSVTSISSSRMVTYTSVASASYALLTNSRTSSMLSAYRRSPMVTRWLLSTRIGRVVVSTAPTAVRPPSPPPSPLRGEEEKTDPVFTAESAEGRSPRRLAMTTGLLATLFGHHDDQRKVRGGVQFYV